MSVTISGLGVKTGGANPTVEGILKYESNNATWPLTLTSVVGSSNVQYARARFTIGSDGQCSVSGYPTGSSEQGQWFLTGSCANMAVQVTVVTTNTDSGPDTGLIGRFGEKLSLSSDHTFEIHARYTDATISTYDVDVLIKVTDETDGNATLISETITLRATSTGDAT